jgi:SNF2 family DNA or RNA helicase
VLAFFDSRLLPLLERDGLSPHALEVLAALTRLRQICCHPGLVMDEYRNAPSGKLDLLMEILNEALDGGHKALVFSQFTGMLDVIEERLNAEGIVSLRLDGSTPVKKREGLVNRFNEDPGVFCFLISLKAGGTGLNLTAADTVIHVDPWWNPAVEDQASARAWRMGQTRPVNVYKLIASESVEEKILALQREKKRLFDAVIGDGDGSFTRLSLEQVRDLFRA